MFQTWTSHTCSTRQFLVSCPHNSEDKRFLDRTLVERLSVWKGQCSAKEHNSGTFRWYCWFTVVEANWVAENMSKFLLQRCSLKMGAYSVAAGKMDTPKWNGINRRYPCQPFISYIRCRGPQGTYPKPWPASWYPPVARWCSEWRSTCKEMIGRSSLTKMLIPYVGTLSVSKRAQIANWFETHISLTKDNWGLWLGRLPIAHAHTVFIAFRMHQDSHYKSLGAHC